MPFFSVIIPVYNRPDLVKEAIQSVLNQDYKDYEIIVVNDGSTDSTLEVLNSYADKIKVFSQENSGVGAARNLGVENSIGNYIAFLDSDDLWVPWTLSSYFEPIVKSNFPSFLSGTSKVFICSDEATLNSSQEDLKYQFYENYFSSLGKRVGFVPSTSVVKASEIKRVGGFSSQRGRIAEDADLWMKLGNSRGFVFIESPFLAFYRKHQDNMMGNILKGSTGALLLIQKEKEGKYPGEKELYLNRITLITKYVRPFSMASLQNKQFGYAIRIYRETFWWHLRMLKLSYLIGFIPIAMFYGVQHSLKKSNGSST